MDGFFGIGIQELVLIAIVALIVLGPERLPAALREVAKFIRQVRNLTRDFTQQFGDDFKALEDLDPRRILQQAITSLDEEEEAKEDPKKGKTTPAKTTSTPKSTATPAKATTPKTTTTTKPAVSTSTKSTTTTAATTTAKATDQPSDKATASTNTPEPTASAPSPSSTEATTSLVASAAAAETENRIAPPEAVNAAQASAEAAVNPIVHSAHTNGASNETAKTISAPPTTEALTTTPATANGTQEHPTVQSE